MTYSLDGNHLELVRVFEQLGCKVVDNAMVKRKEPGQLDVWVGFANPYGQKGIWVWVEIKTASGTLRPSQTNVIAECREMGMPVAVVRNTEQVEELYHAILEYMEKCSKGF